MIVDTTLCARAPTHHHHVVLLVLVHQAPVVLVRLVKGKLGPILWARLVAFEDSPELINVDHSVRTIESRFDAI